MTRDFLISHIIDQGCYPDTDPATDVEGVGQLWLNGANCCYIPYEAELQLETYCHIFYELKVDPPLVHGYDSDYAVYSSFRDVQMRRDIEEIERQRRELGDKN